MCHPVFTIMHILLIYFGEAEVCYKKKWQMHSRSRVKHVGQHEALGGNGRSSSGGSWNGRELTVGLHHVGQGWLSSPCLRQSVGCILGYLEARSCMHKIDDNNMNYQCLENKLFSLTHCVCVHVLVSTIQLKRTHWLMIYLTDMAKITLWMHTDVWKKQNWSFTSILKHSCKSHFCISKPKVTLICWARFEPATIFLIKSVPLYFLCTVIKVPTHNMRNSVHSIVWSLVCVQEYGFVSQSCSEI